MCVYVCVYVCEKLTVPQQNSPTAHKIKTSKEKKSDTVKIQFPHHQDSFCLSPEATVMTVFYVFPEIFCQSTTARLFLLLLKPGTLFHTTVYLKVSNCILKIKSK